MCLRIYSYEVKAYVVDNEVMIRDFIGFGIMNTKIPKQTKNMQKYSDSDL